MMIETMIEKKTRDVEIPDREHTSPGRGLWLRWVAANSIGELVGLGGAAATGAAVFATAGADESLGWRIATAVLMALTGIFEGVVVGLAQWWAMRRALPAIPRGGWVRATTTGAFIAWIFGMIPSVVMGGESGPSDPGPSEGMVLLLAAGMGVVLGPVLGVPQWLLLRRHVPKAGWWIVANSAAWAVGMPIIFIGVGMIVDGGGGLPMAIALGAASCAVAGAAVGAVHGVALRMLVGLRGEG